MNDEPAGELWTGTVRSSCGMADGPAVRIEIRSGAAPACDDTLPADRVIHLEGPLADSLLPGKVFTDQGTGCGPTENCVPAWDYRLKVESADSVSVRGELETRDPVRRVRIRLLKCPRWPGFCG